MANTGKTLEPLFAFQSRWVVHDAAQSDLARQYLSASGLDTMQLRADQTSPDIERLVAQHLAEA